MTSLCKRLPYQHWRVTADVHTHIQTQASLIKISMMHYHVHHVQLHGQVFTAQKSRYTSQQQEQDFHIVSSTTLLLSLFVCLVFNGTFSTNRLYRAIVVGNISCRDGKQHTHIIQETQLLLTNCTTCLEVSQGHQTWYHSICYVWFTVTMLQ